MLDHTLKLKPSGHAWTPRQVDVVRCGLRVEAGSDAGRVLHPLNEQTLIGREAWCDPPLSDPHVSGQHVEVTLAKEGVRIRDLGSTNGTFCGGMRLLDAYLPGDAVLNVGDTSLLTEHERSYFRTLMEQSGGNISRAAQLAGLSRTWFKMGLRRHELL